VTPMLRAARVVTDADRGALIAMCQQWSRYTAANAQVAALGLVVKAPSGYPITNPYLGVSNKCLANLRALWAELGLTPSSRSRVVAGDPEGDADPFAFLDDDDLDTAESH
jgi:P27 family predicted phage terminase small subunit